MGLINLTTTKSKYITGSVIKELCLIGKNNQKILDLYSLLMSQSDEEVELLQTLNILEKLVLQKPLSPLDDPKVTNEYLDHGDKVLQSTRLSSLFSRDNGLTWYDIDRVPKFYWLWSFIYDIIPFGRTTKINWLRNYILDKMLYYVKFPYECK